MFPGATPMVPRHHPVTQMTIASSNFRTPAAIPVCLAEHGHTQHSFVHPSIHLYLHCQFPNFHLSVFTPFPPSIIIPASTSLSLICFSYSLSDLSLPFKRNLLLFTSSTSPSAICQRQHFFWPEWNPSSMTSTDLLNSSQFGNDGLINIWLCLKDVVTDLVKCCSSSHELVCHIIL